MKTTFIRVAVGIAVIGVIAFGYYALSPLWRTSTLDEALPGFGAGQGRDGDAATVLVAQANLVPQAHEVQGSVMLLQTAAGPVVRFEDYQAINGPDLRVYLATDTSADDFVDLGKIKATEGNINYVVPEGTDTDKYDTVLVWCRAFGVLFSYAEFI